MNPAPEYDDCRLQRMEKEDIPSYGIPNPNLEARKHEKTKHLKKERSKGKLPLPTSGVGKGSMS